MARYNFRKPATGASVRQMHNWLCWLMILAITLMKGACATTVLHNKSGRDLVLIIPQQHLNIHVPAGQSVELEQQRGVVIQDVQTGAKTGPLNLPDSPSLEAFQFDPSTEALNIGGTSVVIQGSSASNLNIGGTSVRIRAGRNVHGR